MRYILSLLAALLMVTSASARSIPSSPAERAATAKLNLSVLASNAVARERYIAAWAQYQEQLREHNAKYHSK